ncbi:heme biosynthesis protein HemY [Luteibacter aegosomatis]|uniref:heme biosynthesis HemY N-terminal domain-containing protein n=1 Tax=Luteibacter aegosomatis TaxID=2911537 RepID=UPI001FF7D2E4|nr:heme biosynthesis HemY N-terminal domain-containing protein [Luteibacter aegosomatis]UPG85298.1 heme biosynthesis protein HemY [Luteibacter aegosomatis]
MRLWRWIVGLILVAVLAAFGWHWVAQDPGYVLVHWRGTNVQMTLVTLVAILLLAWAVIAALVALIRWPFGAFTRRQRHMSRRRLADGLVSLVEGRHAEAERDLNRAARYSSVRGPALLAAAEAAERHGESTRALETLDAAAQETPRAARVLRARLLRRGGKAAEAAALLAPEAGTAALTPAGWVEYAEASLEAGDARSAMRALEPLQKSGELGARAYAELESRILAAYVGAAADGATLATLWSQLPKAQRRLPVAVDAYARQAAKHGQTMAAMDEIETALRREWSSQLIATYGAMGSEDIEQRLRRAEAWVDAHPNDAALLTALGRMCVRVRLWGKARPYLERALAIAPNADAWEALGDVYLGEEQSELAQRCYRNALALSRGELTEALPEYRSRRIDTRVTAVEERDQHGVPRLSP